MKVVGFVLGALLAEARVVPPRKRAPRKKAAPQHRAAPQHKKQTPRHKPPAPRKKAAPKRGPLKKKKKGGEVKHERLNFGGIELSGNLSLFSLDEADACRRWVSSQPRVPEAIGPTTGSNEWCRGWPYLFQEHGVVPVVTQIRSMNLSTSFDVIDCNRRGMMHRLSMSWTFVDPLEARDAIVWTLEEEVQAVRVIDENRLRIVWKAPTPGRYVVEARLQYVDDRCFVGGGNDALYLGAFQRRVTSFLSARCDELSTLAVPVLHVDDGPKDEAVKRTPQCRDGETANEVWLAAPGRHTTGNADAMMFGKPVPLVRGSMQKVNGDRKDRWFFDRPDCAYHYFSPPEALECLKATPLLLFVGDSVIRNLFVAFVRALGGDADDDDLKREKDGVTPKHGTFQLDKVQLAYVWPGRAGLDGPRGVVNLLKANWLAKIERIGTVTVVANFGAEHQQDFVCDGTFEANLTRDTTILRNLIQSTNAHFKLVLVTPSITLGLRDPTFAASRSVLTARAMRNLAEHLQKNSSSTDVSILDVANLTKARIDDTIDGNHYQGSSIAAQALVLLNQLCQRPPPELLAS